MKSLSLISLAALLAGCAHVAPIQTTYRPAILDDPKVLRQIQNHTEADAADEMLRAAYGSGKTFGYCLPIRKSGLSPEVFCLITEAGNIYGVFESHTDQGIFYRLASGNFDGNSTVKFPAFDFDVELGKHAKGGEE